MTTVTVAGAAAALRRPLREAAARPFNLTRQFAMLSALVIAALSIAAGWFLDSFLSHRTHARESEFLMQFIDGIVQVEEAKRYFASHGRDDGAGDVQEFQRHLMRLPGVLRVNIYAPNSQILWSTDQSLVGRTFTDNRELEAALGGQATWQTGAVGADAKSEHVDLRHPGTRFVENYLPVWSEREGLPHLAGVVELYRTPAALFEAIDAGRRVVVIGAALASLLLFTTLFSIVWRADRIMRRQQAQLLEAQTMAALGEMASAVAHGLRNPLASIRSSAELALDTEDGAETRELLHEVVVQSDRLEHWVRQYLSYASLETDMSARAPTGEVIERTLQPFTFGLRRRRIEMRIEVAARTPPCRIAPPVLTQILSSLIANAVEART